MHLTEHFTIEEFERSTTALRMGIDNKMPRKYIFSSTILCELVLEPLRMHFGTPVVISSGYRCENLNHLVGGSSTSQHMRGEAVDISLNDKSELRRWFEYIKRNCDFDQLIEERASKTSGNWWIHVSCKPDFTNNRHQVLRVSKV